MAPALLFQMRKTATGAITKAICMALDVELALIDGEDRDVTEMSQVTFILAKMVGWQILY